MAAIVERNNVQSPKDLPENWQDLVLELWEEDDARPPDRERGADAFRRFANQPTPNKPIATYYGGDYVLCVYRGGWVTGQYPEGAVVGVLIKPTPRVVPILGNLLKLEPGDTLEIGCTVDGDITYVARTSDGVVEYSMVESIQAAVAAKGTALEAELGEAMQQVRQAREGIRVDGSDGIVDNEDEWGDPRQLPPPEDPAEEWGEWADD